MREWLYALIVFSLIYVGSAAKAWGGYRHVVQPSLSVSQEYTDNLHLTESNKESEWITVVSPRISYEAQGKTSGLSLSYSPGFTFYKENDDFNTIRQSASLNAHKQLAKHVTLNVYDTFTRTEEPYQRGNLSLTRAEEEFLRQEFDYTLRQEREPYYTNTAGARINYQFGQRDSLGFGVNYRLRREDNGASQDSDTGLQPFGTGVSEDSDRYGANLDFNIWPWRHLGFSSGLSYTRGEFDGETETFDRWQGNIQATREFTRFLDGFVRYRHTVFNEHNTQDDYQVYDPSIGVTWRFAREASLTVGVGYYYRDEQLDEDEDGFHAEIDLDVSKGWKLTPKTMFRFNGGTGYEETYFGSENLGFTTYYEARGTLTHNFTRHLSSDLTVNYRFNQYKDEEPEREDHVGTFTAGLNYQVTRWLRCSLSGTHRIVESNIEFEDYTENSAMLTVSLVPRGILLK